MCVHVGAVRVCSESMNDVTDNAKNNFGDPWTPCISLCSWASAGRARGALASLDLEFFSDVYSCS